MAIPESQLTTWSHQGSVPQSSQTYATIRAALENAGSPYASKDFKIFLQGSYCNDTNIYAESDVDVVIRLDTVFYHDLEALPEAQAAAFRAAHSDALYNYGDFKKDVVDTLTARFGASVEEGPKAIKIAASGNRRNADVIVAAQFRRYFKFLGTYDEDYALGICFFNAANQRIANYPKQHSQNCTTKHQATWSRFKPMVRILKNMRSKMVEAGALEAGDAPSYFLEGLMYNVPNEKFGTTYADTFTNAINWIHESDRTKFVCANEQYYLLHHDPVCWKPASGEKFLAAVTAFWNDW